MIKIMVERQFYRLELAEKRHECKLFRNGEGISSAAIKVAVGDEVVYNGRSDGLSIQALDILGASKEGVLSVELITHVLRPRFSIEVPSSQYEVTRATEPEPEPEQPERHHQFGRGGVDLRR